MTQAGRQLAARPLFVVALLIACGIAIRHDPLNWIWGLGLLMLVAKHRVFFFGLAAVGIGLLLGSPVAQFEEPVHLHGEGRVMTVPRPSGEYDRALVHTEAGRLYARFPAAAGVSLGDRVALEGEIRPLENPGWWGRGASAAFRESQTGEILSRGSFLWRWGVAARDSFGRATEGMASSRANAYLNSVCFSQTGGLEDEDWASLRQSGTLHVVSTSGLHVVIAASGLLLVLSRLPISRLIQLALLCFILLIYAGAAGFRPPILRAVMMAMITGVAYVLKRERDGLSMLGLTALILMIWMPEVVFEMNFQLSFLSVAILIMFGTMPQLPEKLSAFSWARISLVTVGQATFVITIGLFPVIALYTGVTSWTSLLANVMIVPLLPVLIGLAVISWAISGVHSPSGTFLMQEVVTPFTGWLIAIVDLLGSPDWAVIRWPEFHPLWLVPYYGLLLVFWRPKARTIIL